MNYGACQKHCPGCLMTFSPDVNTCPVETFDDWQEGRELTHDEMEVIKSRRLKEQVYTADKIISNSWGYEQTNIDFYKILKRSGLFVTLQLMTSQNVSAGDMVGTCIPKDVDTTEKPFRRKVCIRNGRETGLSIKQYGWASIWDGKPVHYTSYA